MSDNGYNGFAGAPGQGPNAAQQPSAPAPGYAPPAAGADPGPQAAQDGQHGLGPFSIREVALMGVTVLLIVLSFIPVTASGYGLSISATVWTTGLGWIPTVVLPVIAVGLLVVRRFAPTAIPRVGSLGVDQVASVVFGYAALLWFLQALGSVTQLAGVGASGINVSGRWAGWVAFVIALGGVALTAAAPFIPVLKDDFQERPEAPAHPVARAARPIVAAPKAPKPQPQAQAPYAGGPAGGAQGYGQNSTGQYGFGGFDPNQSQAQPNFGQTGGYDPNQSQPQPGYQQTGGYAQGGQYQTGAVPPVSSAPEPAAPPVESAPASAPEPAAASAASAPAAEEAPAAQQAFWALVPEERQIIDQNSVPIFTVGPTAWALVIEDRGNAFVVRHEDGRVGFLLDVSGVTRG